MDITALDKHTAGLMPLAVILLLLDCHVPPSTVDSIHDLGGIAMLRVGLIAVHDYGSRHLTDLETMREVSTLEHIPDMLLGILKRVEQDEVFPGLPVPLGDFPDDLRTLALDGFCLDTHCLILSQILLTLRHSFQAS